MNQLTNTPQYNEEESEIDLLELFGYYMSRLPWLIGALIIRAVIAGLVTHFLITDKFTATSRLYMVSASSDSVVNLADLNLGTSISNDYVELMKSRPVIEEVIEKLDLDYTYGQVLEMLSLSVVNNTRIVKISVTSTSPQEAMDIANQMARTARVQLPKVMEAPTPSIAEYAVLPKAKSSPSLKRNVMIGALIGLAIVLGIFTLLFLMDDTIKSSDDLERYFGVMPLSVIPEGNINISSEGSESGAKKTKRTRRKSRTGGKNS